MYSAIILILPLALLMFAAFRGWSVLVAAPVMALVGAALSSEPVMATLTERYMPALGGFIISYLPLFLLGAVFGRLMEVSGAALSIARAIVDRLGPAQAIPAVVLACAVLTYGGVSLFVVAFAIYPLALALFRAAGVSDRLIPGAIALGAFTFTMSALPGTPAIQNAIPMPYFGTNAFAAPGLGILAAAVMAIGGLIYLHLASLRPAFQADQAEPQAADISMDGSDGPLVFFAALPVVLVIALNFLLSKLVFPVLDLSYLASSEWGDLAPGAVIGIWSLILSLTASILALIVLMWSRLETPVTSIGEGAEAALLPLFNTASLVGFGAVVAGLPAFAAVIALIDDLPGGPVLGLAASTSLLAGITGSASGGMSIALEALGAQYLQQALALGISPELLHRVTTLATGGLDALPHNGAVITLLGIGGLSHKQAYGPIFVVAVLIPVAALATVLILSSILGSF